MSRMHRSSPWTLAQHFCNCGDLEATVSPQLYRNSHQQAAAALMTVSHWQFNSAAASGSAPAALSQAAAGPPAAAAAAAKDAAGSAPGHLAALQQQEAGKPQEAAATTAAVAAPRRRRRPARRLLPSQSVMAKPQRQSRRPESGRGRMQLPASLPPHAGAPAQDSCRQAAAAAAARRQRMSSLQRMWRRSHGARHDQPAQPRMSRVRSCAAIQSAHVTASECFHPQLLLTCCSLLSTT